MTCNIDLLLEKWIGNVRETWKIGEKDIDVFINPDRKELKELTDQNNNFYAIIIPNKNDVIAFRRDVLHFSVIEQLKIKGDIVTATVYVDGNNLGLMITDATRHGKWFHNPSIEEYVSNNKFLKKYNIDFTYYDESIVGDWSKL